MRRILFSLIVVIFLTTACAPGAAPTAEETIPTGEPTPISVSTEPETEEVPIGPVEEAVRKQLAENLGLEESEITVVSSQEMEFGDACLGVVIEGVMCAQVVTPGRVIVLEANGLQYQYHVSEDGRRVQPADLALVWRREGGIAGFCDVLTVFHSGEVYASQCASQAEGTPGTFATLLTARELLQFQGWLREYEETKLDASDPKGVADRMVVTLEFYGMGKTAPTVSEQQDLFNFAQDLYQKLK